MRLHGRGAMKKNLLILSLIIFAAFAFIVQVSAEEMSIDSETLKKIIKRQDELKKRNNDLEKEVNELKQQVDRISSKNPEAGAFEIMREDTDEMSERLDQIETRSILDKIQISGELRTQLDYLNIDNFKTGSEEKNTRLDELWSSRFRMNLRSEITDNLIFHGRLRYYKFWGDTNYDDSKSRDRDMLSPNLDGDLHVERAYIDYFIPDTQFSLTIGRNPSSDGPPYEFKNKTTRKATWPQLFVNAEIDAVVANIALEKWTGLKDAMFRTGYAKVSQNYRQYEGRNLDSCRVGVAVFETQFPYISDSLLWVGINHITKMLPLTDADLPAISWPENAGRCDGYTAHLQFNDIKNSGLGWFGSFTWQNIHPDTRGTRLASGYEIGLLGDNLHNDLGKKRKGYAFYTGLKYTLPVSKMKNPVIGFEYNHGSQYWLPVGMDTSRDFINKLQINGSAYELYYIQPVIKKYMFCRIGAVYQDFDYYTSTFVYGSKEGEENRSDMSVLNTYFIVDVRF